MLPPFVTNSLMEGDFACRSAEYSASSKRCTLSRDDRRTQPESFRQSGPAGAIATDYIENQCSKILPDCSYTTLKSDVTVIALDDILFSRTTADCQR